MVPISFISDKPGDGALNGHHIPRNLALHNGFATSAARVRCPNDDPYLARCLKDTLLQHGL